MGDEAVSGGLCLIVSQHRTDNSSPVLLGASCALFALRLLLEPNLDGKRWSEPRKRILDGGAQLLGLLVWSIRKEVYNRVRLELVDKLESAEREIEELKSRRSEDAKANEKVVSIFATQEQSWFGVRKKLQHQVGALLHELRSLEKNKDEVIRELNVQLQEKELLLQSKENSIKEQLQKNLDLEEKLKEANSVAEELREAAKNVVEEHSTEIWKHKTALIELVSTQRQLEAEMGRAVRQVEAAKQDLDSVLEQKEQSVSMTQKLSMELIRMRKDLEQKDTILSAMLRKSKLDTEEKQMLLKEVKLSKTKRKQAELETERWRTASEAKHERHSLRSMLSKHAKSKLEASLNGMGMPFSTTTTQLGRTRSVETALIEYEQPELQDEQKYSCSSSDVYKPSGTEELDFKQMEGWVRFEAEKYATAFEQRHHKEIDAFAEQMRLKDEKLESCHWRSLSMELELKRLQTHIEGLNLELSHIRQENLQLEALFLNREAELQSLKEASILQLKHPSLRRSNSSSSSQDLSITGDTIWSNVKIVKSRPGDKEYETTLSRVVGTKIESAVPVKDYSKDIILMAPSPAEDFQEEKVVILDPSSIQGAHNNAMVINDDKLASDSQLLSTKNDNNSWKMDLNALGVSFKIKRIKQQLLLFERLTGKVENPEDRGAKDIDHSKTKGVLMLISFLDKQVSRYLSLQGKIDDLCKQMHENEIYASSGSSVIARKREETKKLEHFLEDTFQLQRYIVATGQKSMEIQTKIKTGLLGATEHPEGHADIDMHRFAESLITLFKDVQRGVEVRISKIIGDLEGTLACEGMNHPRK
ncbi:uncharacterized protein LOC108214089 isoform X2 [Daucus carota subsp. sativus]|uniref:Uncharacterized protein n=1 Tax=Daucus carota subsp. sativus TaxID=79200 RepID=A0A169W9J9_DAUCS|nr:PREDICTED: GRIP1-associated protein 1 isoform X2 [Daucus carota subsp. sativus]